MAKKKTELIEPTSREPTQCTPDLSVRCWALDHVLIETNSRRAGVALERVINFKTDRIRIRAVGATASAKHRGIRFVLCPFCGVKFQDDPESGVVDT